MPKKGSSSSGRGAEIRGDVALGKRYGVSSRQVQTWRQEKGLPHRVEKGTCVYDVAVTDNFVALIQKPTGPTDEGTRKLVEQERQAKAILAQTKAAKALREEKAAAGNILPRDEYVAFASEVVSIARDKFRRIGPAICRVVPATCHAAVMGEVEKETQKILSALAKSLGRGPDT